MADNDDNNREKEKENDAGETIERWVGMAVVVLATFLGLCNVKDGNIVQAMEKQLVEKNDNWAWYQARNIREGLYQSTADQLSIPFPDETSEIKLAREKMVARYQKEAASQGVKMKKQMEDAQKAEKAYEDLNNKDDQFDLSEAALAVGLAMMGVTALIKRWWMFWIAMVPSVFGVFMGSAGFAGMDTNTPAIKWFVQLLS